MYVYKYERPLVTVDIVLFSLSFARQRGERPELLVLLIKRENPPYQDCWALPGGFIDMKEELVESARREMAEETGVTLKASELHPFYVAGQPGRDPRGRVISIVYLALGRADKLRPKASDDAKEFNWFSMYNLPALAFDHRVILARAVKELRRRVLNVAEIRRLVPQKFTLLELRQAYETIYDQRFNAAQFNRAMLDSRALTPAGKVKIKGKSYKLYSLKRKRKKASRRYEPILKFIH